MVVKSMGAGHLARVQILALAHIHARPRGNSLDLCLSCLICKMGIIIVYTSRGFYVKSYESTHVKHFHVKQCLPHSKSSVNVSTTVILSAYAS